MYKISAEAEAVALRCSVKKLFLEISQNSQENTCVRVSFLIKKNQSLLFLKNTSGGCFFNKQVHMKKWSLH